MIEKKKRQQKIGKWDDKDKMENRSEWKSVWLEKGQNALSADVVDFVNSQVLFTVLVALGRHPFLLMTVIRHVSSPPTAVPFPHSPCSLISLELQDDHICLVSRSHLGSQNPLQRYTRSTRFLHVSKLGTVMTNDKIFRQPLGFYSFLCSHNHYDISLV